MSVGSAETSASIICGNAPIKGHPQSAIFHQSKPELSPIMHWLHQARLQQVHWPKKQHHQRWRAKVSEAMVQLMVQFAEQGSEMPCVNRGAISFKLLTTTFARLLNEETRLSTSPEPERKFVKADFAVPEVNQQGFHFPLHSSRLHNLSCQETFPLQVQFFSCCDISEVALFMPFDCAYAAIAVIHSTPKLSIIGEITFLPLRLLLPFDASIPIIDATSAALSLMINQVLLVFQSQHLWTMPPILFAR